MSTTEAVLTMLDQKSGNTKATAAALDVSPSYVARIKREKWRPKNLAVLSPPEPPFDPVAALMSSCLPPNIAGITGLRDEALKTIKDRIAEPEGGVSTSELIKILKLLLDYENSLWSVIKPAINVNVDARRQKLGGSNLVDTLSGLPEDVLRDLLQEEGNNDQDW